MVVVILAGVRGDLCWLMKKLCPDLAIVDNGRVSLINDAAGCALRRFLSSVYEIRVQEMDNKTFRTTWRLYFYKIKNVCVYFLK